MDGSGLDCSFVFIFWHEEKEVSVGKDGEKRWREKRRIMKAKQKKQSYYD